MDTCIFCRIAKGEIPADVVYQDADVVVFRDLHPQAPVHVLAVPRRHIASLVEPGAADGQVLAPVFRSIQQVASKLGLEQGFRVVTNHGEHGGQSVGHIHFHVLGKRQMQWPPG
ncbi:MAG TPA: histidine triad nucleotide-binding protein [Candidatus Ozemobacteraceae bacterium]|nr:histidine triad nucleotide-binding protein [Candidatus Ozemobacteraceae bacterium]HQG28953.1 histidine triad nucleotide-binding protein [Candidatus Ozemobacteraceae bacterium]